MLASAVPTLYQVRLSIKLTLWLYGKVLFTLVIFCMMQNNNQMQLKFDKLALDLPSSLLG